MSSQTIVLNDSDYFNVSIEGPEGAPWIVLSNSLATNLTLWDEFAEAMRGRYRIFRYDQRGHGRSVATAPPYSFSGLVADVIGLMDSVGISRAHFVGISMGAATGWGLALHHADRLASLTVCDGATAASATPEWEERLKIVKANGLAPLVEPTLERWFTKRSMAQQTDAVKRVRAMIGSTSVAGFTGCVNALQSYNYSDGLESIRVPTLLVAGAEDGTRPKAMAADAARVPGAQFAIIPDAGHLSNIENPTEFNRIVQGFVDAVTTRSRSPGKAA